MLSRRLFCFAAPALILTPGILMPVKKYEKFITMSELDFARLLIEQQKFLEPKLIYQRTRSVVHIPYTKYVNSGFLNRI